MRGSNASKKMCDAKRDRRRYIGDKTKMLMKKYVVVQKNRETRGRQRQSGAAENRAAGLTARRCEL